MRNPDALRSSARKYRQPLLRLPVQTLRAWRLLQSFGMACQSLSALDSAFLAIEDERNHMHIALTAVFDRAPLCTSSGQLDVERILRYARSAVSTLPRFRSKIARVPVLREPVLVDDPNFDVRNHMRFLELGAPGDDHQLKELIGRIYSEPLDRSRPLWEQWYVDRVEGDRLAMVIKVHHCLVDGVAGVEVLSTLLRTTPDTHIPEPEPAPAQQATPTGRELFTRELRRRISGQSALLDVARRTFKQTSFNPKEMFQAAKRLAAVFRQALTPTSRTPLNPHRIGGIREFDWVRFDLDEVKAIKRAAQTTVNDVVLAIVAGGVRRYLAHHGTAVERTRFRAMVPVSMHRGGAQLQNEVSLMLTDLPIGEPDACRRLEQIAKATRDAKASGQTEALALGGALADLTVHAIIALAAKVVIRMRPFNVIITNIPGPQFPLYFLGTKLLHAYPMVPLYTNQAVGIAILSYDGKLNFGLNGDAAHMPDLQRFAAGLLASFRELEQAYGTARAPRHAPPAPHSRPA